MWVGGYSLSLCYYFLTTSSQLCMAPPTVNFLWFDLELRPPHVHPRPRPPFGTRMQLKLAHMPRTYNNGIILWQKSCGSKIPCGRGSRNISPPNRGLTEISARISATRLPLSKISQFLSTLIFVCYCRKSIRLVCMRSYWVTIITQNN
jgi:hypothetical protein